ncbi:MAG: hypothetical protein KAJ86_06890 [Alphaproteobacteria bacterium]|nr:hypothetical protein [Alphaproteobacteria bacterium]
MTFIQDAARVSGGQISAHVIENTLESINKTVDKDLVVLQKDANFIFSTLGGVHEQTKNTVELLKRWHFIDNAPSLMSLCILTIENLKLDLPEEYVKALLLASVLGEIENNNPYHNNIHFKKVLLQTIRMIVMHNDIYAGTKKILGDKDIALLLIAACIHDLGHDGKGNTVKGIFKQGHLEAQSIDMSEPYLKYSGLDDKKILEYLRVMLLCTDTSPLGDPVNLMNQMKSAYRFHFLGEDEKAHTLNLDPEISLLQSDKKLTIMSIILHEADIATSAGMSYEVTKYETSIFIQELKDDDAHPQQIIAFLNQVCQRKFLSNTGQRLYSANLARIYTLAEEDFKNGNHAFPKPEHSDFLIAYGAGNTDSSSSKTIN